MRQLGGEPTRLLQHLDLALAQEAGQRARNQPPGVAVERLHEGGRPGRGLGGEGEEESRQEESAPHLCYLTTLAFRETLPSLVSSRNSTAAFPPLSLRMREACWPMSFWKLSYFTGAFSPFRERARRKLS